MKTLLIIDPVTDATETAAIVKDMETGEQTTITDPAKIRAFYDDPTASAYGDGSYTVSV